MQGIQEGTRVPDRKPTDEEIADLAPRYSIRRSRRYDSCQYDATVVGSGPNGLAAAITLARAGRRVLMLEARDTIGGGCRSAELTLPGFVHDICSAIQPGAVNSQFMRSLPLARYGLQWIYSPLALAHPFDDGTAAALSRSVMDSSLTMRCDALSYRKLMTPIVRDWDKVSPAVLAPFSVPRHIFALARFGIPALLSARLLVDHFFKGPHARGLFAGVAAHSMLSLDSPGSAAAGIVLGTMAHAVGWPMSRGGSQRIVDAMAHYLRSLGGEIVTGVTVNSGEELPGSGPSSLVMYDVTPRQLAQIEDHRLREGYKRRLGRYRYGPGVFKVDYALDGPVPWKAAECNLAATVHLGGTFEEIAEGEAAVWRGENPQMPFVLTAQSSRFDPARAPAGKHTLWAYCHVPHGSTFDMTERIEAQIERFAPGFRNRILARHTMSPAEMQSYNANYIGGDINGGVQDLRQMFTRPVPKWQPYRTPTRGIYICSSSTPPGGGVHGLCGYYAARAALDD
ncbi:MAG: NAD(P)-binding protein [Chloroflexota bacterium]|nr:NAD(P)-binding protein [Chloroflexota bacterium]